MDQKAKEAGCDQDQWDSLVKDALTFKDKIGDTFTILHTIEPYRLYVMLMMKDGRSSLMEMNTTEACHIEFPKCEVLAETVFKR